MMGRSVRWAGPRRTKGRDRAQKEECYRRLRSSALETRARAGKRYCRAVQRERVSRREARAVERVKHTVCEELKEN